MALVLMDLGGQIKNLAIDSSGRMVRVNQCGHSRALFSTANHIIMYTVQLGIHVRRLLIFVM